VARSFCKRRNELACYLEGATRFSDDGVLDDPRLLIRAIKRIPQLRALLAAEAGLASPYGRPRLPGSYVLLYAAFCIDRDADVESFYNRHRTSDLWRLSGFERVPSINTLYTRFAELSRLDATMQESIGALVGTARRHVPEIGRHVHIDGSLAASHARLQHACDRSGNDRGCGNNDPHPLPSRLSEDEAIHQHHQEDAAPADEDATRSAAALEALDDEGLRRWGLDPLDPAVRRSRWYEREGHLLRCRDPEAGVRTYRALRGKQRTTIGTNHLLVTDHVTGGTLAFDVVPADRNEHACAADLMDDTQRLVGLYPQAMVADRGFHTRGVFTSLHDRQITYVGPWRKTHHQPTRADAAAAADNRVDRHGVIRCRHCGGPTVKHGRHLGTVSSRGRTAIRVRCAIQTLPECAGTQTTQPSVEPRLIAAIDRTDEVYWQLRHTHSNRERAHAERRSRCTVGGRDVLTRTKRLGIAPQRVRLRFAQLIDWVRICLRYGWVKAPKGRRAKRHQIAWVTSPGAYRAQNVHEVRIREGLDIPTLANDALDAIARARARGTT
jgi:hypothetical protein